MTFFDLGDLITVLVLLFVLLYFRARDSNNRSIDEVRHFLDNVRSNLELRFQGMLNDLEERTVDMQAQRDLNIEFMRRGEQSYQNFAQSVEGLEAAQQRLEALFQSIQRYEEELGEVEKKFSKVDQQTEQIHKLDTHLKEQRRWAAELQNHLVQKLDDHKNLLNNDLNQHVAEQKENLGTELVRLSAQLADLQKNSEQQAEALQKVNRARSEWDKVERMLQSDTEHFRQGQQALHEKLQEILLQNSQLEDKIGVRQSYLQDLLDQLEQGYNKSKQDLAQELERHRLDLREHLARDVQALQHEQQTVVSRESEALLQQTVEQVQQRLQEFEHWCNIYFEKFSGIEADIKKDHNILLEHFRNDMKLEVEQMKLAYREQANELFGDWNILSQNYQGLQDDFEQIEGRSREELSTQFELYEKNFIEELNRKQSSHEEHIQIWQENLRQQLDKLNSRVELEQEETWQRNREHWERQLEAERRNLKEQLRISKQQIQSHESDAQHELQELMAELKMETKTQQESFTQQNRDRDNEIRMRLDEHTTKLEQWSQKFQQMEKGLQDRNHRLEEQYETLNLRIQTDVQQMANNFETIEQQQQHILSNGKLIERAENLWRDTRDQISKLREQSSVLTTYADQSRHLEKEFEYIRQLAQEVGEKLRVLEASEERAEILQQNINDIEQTLEQTASKWEELQTQNNRLQQMEEYLGRIEDVYQERGKEFLALEEQAQNLESHQAQVLQHINHMQDIQTRVSSVEKMIVPLEDKARELSRLQELIEQNAGQTEQVFEQVSLLQDLLESAQQRSGELQHMRTWLVNAEERVKEMSQNLDANIHLAEQVALQQGNVQNFTDHTQDLNRIDEETRTMVFQLAEKGWDNMTIAKQLNISIGAVELILEMSSII